VLLHQLKRAGVDEVVLSVGHMSSLLRAFFQEGQHIGIHIGYSYEKTPLGTAGPLALVEGLDETFLVMNGDVLTTLDFRELLEFHHRSQAQVTIAMYNREVKIDLGVLQLNGGHEVVGYIEKPTYGFQVSMGVYVFEPAVLKYIPPGQYFDFPNLILRLIDAGERVVGFPFSGYWQDLGRPDDYEQAILDFETMRDQFLIGDK
jgi:NDP-sugar pyrophosphorylase family protein